LESVVDNLKASGTSEITIHFDPTASDQTELELDINLMNGVFLNLIKNAAENAAEHVSELEAREERCVSVKVRKQQRRVCVSITNGGPPIPEERIDSFFEKFNTLGKDGGTGLGTTYAALVTHAHGGEIDVTSTAENGTTVTVTIPESIP
jgi:signal transduction histidine kinase